jgi:hypothetical protein
MTQLTLMKMGCRHAGRRFPPFKFGGFLWQAKSYFIAILDAKNQNVATSGAKSVTTLCTVALAVTPTIANALNRNGDWEQTRSRIALSTVLIDTDGKSKNGERLAALLRGLFHFLRLAPIQFRCCLFSGRR